MTALRATSLGKPDAYTIDDAEPKSLVEAVMDAICNNRIRDAEVELHAFTNPVSDHTDLTAGYHRVTWRRPFLSRICAALSARSRCGR
jgi:hypothetical protein